MDDSTFYKEVSPSFNGQTYLVPPPTLNPDERYQRRLTWRNDRHLYHRTCAKTAQPILSMFSPDKPLVVYDVDLWWSDDWDQCAAGQEFDFGRPFFEQYAELLSKTPLPALSMTRPTLENADYCNHVTSIKNGYLLFDCRFSENCLYGKTIERSYDCVDCYKVFDSEACYEAVGAYNCHTCTYVKNCFTCANCDFCEDLTGCKYCFGCINLRNKQYYVFNEPCSSPEEWAQKVADLKKQHSAAELMNMRDALRLKLPCRFMQELKTEHCTGDYLFECTDTKQSFDCEYLQDCAYCQDVKKDSEVSFQIYDVTHFGGNLTNCLEGISLGNTAKSVLYSAFCFSNVSDLLYCYYCLNGSKNLFGCIGQHRAEYRILNKQYSKEEYEELVPRIIEHMKSTGEWGEFFPSSISPFAYNETIAMEFFPLEKSDVEAKGWRWNDHIDPLPDVKKTIEANRLPPLIADIPDDILNWSIVCEKTGRPFRIIAQELEFYRKLNLPIPHLHPDERHRLRLEQRNPRHLWSRSCAMCQKPIETAYEPNSAEIVYCEECYLSEVY